MSSILYLDQPTDVFVDGVMNDERISKYDDVKYIYTHFTRPNYSRFKNLKAIMCPCTCINHLGKIPEGVKVFNLDDRRYLYDNVWSTSEWALNSINRLLQFCDDSLSDKTVGIVGAGRIGQQMSKLLSGYDCEILYHDVNHEYIPLDLKPVVSLEMILHMCDVITVHLREDERTKSYFSEKEFKKMLNKPIFVNCSRSSIVDEYALLEAYKKDDITAFALDVIEDYDIITKSEIMRLNADSNEGVYLTPHTAGKKKHSRIMTDLFVLKNFQEWRKHNESE